MNRRTSIDMRMHMVACVCVFFAVPLFLGAQDQRKKLRLKGDVKIILENKYYASANNAELKDTGTDRYVSVLSGNAFFCDGINGVSADLIRIESGSKFTAEGNVNVRYDHRYLTSDTARGQLNPRTLVLNAHPKNSVRAVYPKMKSPDGIAQLPNPDTIEKECATLNKTLHRFQWDVFFPANRISPVQSHYTIKSRTITYNANRVTATGSVQLYREREHITFVADRIDVVPKKNMPGGSPETDASVIQFIDASGDVHYKDTIYDLRSDRSVYTPKTRILRADGNVRLAEHNNVLMAEHIELEANNPNFSIKSTGRSRMKINTDEKKPK